MGLENMLILIDGKLVSSCNLVCQGWCGECDICGDIFWVLFEMIECIEVLCGLVVVCYGNGVVGGVVNIIIKKGSGEWYGFWDVYFNVLEYKEEGVIKCINFSLIGLLGDEFSFCLYGNFDKIQVDVWDINQGYQFVCVGMYVMMLLVGCEGVINKDINGVVCWDFVLL